METGIRHAIEAWERLEGAPSPLGATWVGSARAWNFSLYSRSATAVTLLIFAADDDAAPVLEFAMDPLVHKTGRIWHCLISAARVPGAAYYGYRVSGPSEAPHRFAPHKILLDPHAQHLHFPAAFSREAARGSEPNDGQAVLGVLPQPDWDVQAPPTPAPRHTHDLVVYELHVKGFTARENSGVPVQHRGRFRGVVDKIPHLLELGVTAVELLPVHQFDPQEGNYWGYMTMNFYAPHHGYAQSDPIGEFREMVEALHAAGIEVWLDVVYNHTAEGDEHGPTYSLRGLDNDSYYIVEPDGSYANLSGCGNTTRDADPAMRALVLRSLLHWSQDLGVDGFRFDLASILARGDRGEVQTASNALVNDIGMLVGSQDVRLVAEAWDLGAYLLGQVFPGIMWKQWNGRFRDDVRSFVKGDDGFVPALMRRVYGSDDLFPDGPGDMYRPYQSVNFVTAHDGFCLYDLVSYDERHNEANGHDNTDGSADNRSWNCGWEGDVDAPDEVLTLRMRQLKNLIALLMLSNGVPMLVAGDEFGHTQGGNNNPYNQDNGTTWLDWDRLTTHRELFDFVKGMIALRKARRAIARSRFWRDDVTWYGTSGGPDLAPCSHSVAWHLSGAAFDEGDLYVMVNAYHERLDFDVQVPGAWRRIVDTSRSTGEDVCDHDSAPEVDGGPVPVGPRSVVVLATRPA